MAFWVSFLKRLVNAGETKEYVWGTKHHTINEGINSPNFTYDLQVEGFHLSGGGDEQEESTCTAGGV